MDDWPQELQQVIRIERRQREPMGIGLVSAEEVTHLAPHRAGMYIRAVTQEGLIGRDGRLREGYSIFEKYQHAKKLYLSISSPRVTPGYFWPLKFAQNAALKEKRSPILD